MSEPWSDLPVDGLDGREIGLALGTFVDAESGEPAWLVLRQGRFRGTLVVAPLRDCVSAGGRVWIAHAGEAVRDAPVVDPTRPLLREHELTICSHYGIGERVGRAAEVAERAEGSITSRPG